MGRKLRIASFLLISTIWIGVLIRHWKVYQNIPKNYEWNAVDEFIKENAASDDLILFDPPWLSGYAQDWGRLNKFSTVTRREIFKKTCPPSSKLWLLSLWKVSALTKQLENAGFAADESHPIYSIHLTRYSMPAKNLTYNFTGHLTEADVFVDYGEGGVMKAQNQGGVWAFGDNQEDWNKVSVLTQSFRGQLRRCIWFHPLETGIKTIQYARVPVGKRMELFGGIVDSGLRTPPGAPVYLFIQVDGKEMGRYEFQDTDTTFHHVIDTTSLLGSDHQVAFQVQTPRANARHFCFSAWSIKE